MVDRSEQQGSVATAATERARALLRARAQTAVATTVARPIEPPAGTTTLIKNKFSPRAVTGAPALPARIQAWENLHEAPRWLVSREGAHGSCIYIHRENAHASYMRVARIWLLQMAYRCTHVILVVHRERAHESYVVPRVHMAVADSISMHTSAIRGAS